MKILIDIPEEVYECCLPFKGANIVSNDCNYLPEMTYSIANGIPFPKGHSFIAICDSDFPITEEVIQELKDTVFVGNEDCNYCFDMTEIIKTDKAESEEEE